jgi:hypothetical protein
LPMFPQLQQESQELVAAKVLEFVASKIGVPN